MDPFTFVLALAAMIMGFVYVMTRMRLKRQDSAAQVDEAAFMQEMHQNLARMEARIESLETLLLEREASAARSNDQRVTD